MPGSVLSMTVPLYNVGFEATSQVWTASNVVYKLDRGCSPEDSWLSCRPHTTNDRDWVHRRKLGRSNMISRWEYID